MEMETDRCEEFRRFKWTPWATNLIVSIWSHELIQKQLKESPRNYAIWDSIARYMTRKGFPVTGLQCKTRIKNMIYYYYEAIKRDDPRMIEPYYDIFKKVLSARDVKKSETTPEKVQPRTSDATHENEGNLTSKQYDPSRFNTETSKNKQHEMESSSNNQSEDTNSNKTTKEFVKNKELEIESDTNTQESGDANSNTNKIVKELGNIILKAIDAQTQTITAAVQMQTQLIEKLLLAERLRFETMLASEKETRQKLETRLDSLLAKFETHFLPPVTYMSSLVDVPQHQ